MKEEEEEREEEKEEKEEEGIYFYLQLDKFLDQKLALFA